MAFMKNVKHEYLEGMEEIKYGEFYLAYEDNNELSIVYKNITNAAFHIILNNMKTYGFVIDSSEQKELDDNNTYLYYFYPLNITYSSDRFIDFFILVLLRFLKRNQKHEWDSY